MRNMRLSAANTPVDKLARKRLRGSKLPVDRLITSCFRLSVTKTVKDASELKKTSTRIFRIPIFFADTFPHLISS